MTRLASDLSSNSQDPKAHIPLVLQPDQSVARAKPERVATR